MTLPSAAGQAVLRELVKHMKTGRVIPNDPSTFAGYKQIHDALNLPRLGGTYGDSLKVQGLKDLAEWTKRERHPAVTGLIVDQGGFTPGKGYFDVFGKRETDFAWWKREVERSLSYDWEQFLPASSPPETPTAADFPEPPVDRAPMTVYRILRDNELARRVKVMHNYDCQMCGYAIQLPDGSRYAEAHHIRPLGTPHGGPDTIGNILCLCPNHHAELDYFVSELSLSSLRKHSAHVVDRKHVDYHNRQVRKQRRV